MFYYLKFRALEPICCIFPELISSSIIRSYLPSFKPNLEQIKKATSKKFLILPEIELSSLISLHFSYISGRNFPSLKKKHSKKMSHKKLFLYTYSLRRKWMLEQILLFTDCSGILFFSSSSFLVFRFLSFLVHCIL